MSITDMQPPTLGSVFALPRAAACLAVSLIPFLILLPQAQSQVLLERAVVVTGEWYPFTSESMDDRGILSGLVTEVLRGMGRLPDYQFLPFSVALESTRNGSAIGTFPWFETVDRKKEFVYSDPILDVEYVIYFNRETETEIADITFFDDLRPYRTRRVLGYAYGKLDCLIERRSPPDCSGPNTNEGRLASDFVAFEELARKEIDYVATSRIVGEAIVRRAFAFEDRRKFAILDGAEFSWPMSLHFLFSNDHPDADALKDAFDVSLQEIREAGRIAELRQLLATRTYSDLGIVVFDEPTAARRQWTGSDDFVLPAGTRAHVLAWGSSFLGDPGTTDTSGDGSTGTHVQLMNGPMRGESVWVADQSVRLD
ncbi:MAG: amino acid ABC transporter substrate-binding protein [Hyphomicrobiales bacterium]|nr:amino acid ABC transporter substrate-binding protein [Hyphomicrobiales bacterium]